jgi:hypothetical protein
MRSHVAFLKQVGDGLTEDLLRDVIEKEEKWSSLLPEGRENERLFPSVAVWGTKRV